MKPDEIRSMKPEERLKKLEELRMELIKLRMQAKVGLLKDTARIKNIKRDIARILTIMNEELRASKKEASEQ
ncbi:MAG: 50S ribosomal protein L29 [Desulfurococcaceae archaeon]